MTRKPGDNPPLTYRLDGRKIKSPSDFYREIGAAVNGPGGYFGRNLDALADCLRGGYGTPEHRPYEFDWQHSALSRERLGVVGHTKQPLFDAIRDVFEDNGVRLHLN